MDERMKDLIKIIPLEFESIMKKVALNPLVFQCYNYVNTVRDPETGADLYDGDFADYISWCVIWATEKFYGVSPSFIIDLPSEYTRMKQIKKARRESNNPYYNPYTPSSINNPQARQIPYSIFPPPFKQKTEED